MEALAEDAAQGVFLLLSQKAKRLSGYETLAGWLYTASRYLSQNLMKQERRRRQGEANALLQTSPAPDATNPLWEQIEPHFHDALTRLKPGDREAILLRFVQEQSLAEIGASLGLSENTARMRINRALEKIRTHLARTGIAVTAAALSVLLEEQAAQAAPVSLIDTLARSTLTGTASASTTALTVAVRQVSQKFALQPLLKAGTALLVVLLLGGGAARYRQSLPQRLDATEQGRLYTALAGTWKGNIEFADDQNGRRYTYPTTVTFETQDRGDTLLFVSRYEGSSKVDETTFTRSPRTGQITVRNGGEQSSHRLTGIGELVRLPQGGFAFQGYNAGRDMQIRIRITLSAFPDPRANRLTLQEEYLPPTYSAYQFRNRYTLQRQ